MQHVPCFWTYGFNYMCNHHGDDNRARLDYWKTGWLQGCLEAMEEGLLDVDVSCEYGRHLSWYLVGRDDLYKEDVWQRFCLLQPCVRTLWENIMPLACALSSFSAFYLTLPYLWQDVSVIEACLQKYCKQKKSPFARKVTEQIQWLQSAQRAWLVAVLSH